jgi:hypothetical protein
MAPKKPEPAPTALAPTPAKQPSVITVVNAPAAPPVPPARQPTYFNDPRHRAVAPSARSDKGDSNLPTPGKFTAQLDAAAAEARAVSPVHTAKPQAVKWSKVGIRPPPAGQHGWTFIAEFFEDDDLVRTVRVDGRSKMECREKLAMHFAAIQARF